MKEDQKIVIYQTEDRQSQIDVRVEEKACVVRKIM